MHILGLLELSGIHVRIPITGIRAMHIRLYDMDLWIEIRFGLIMKILRFILEIMVLVKIGDFVLKSIIPIWGFLIETHYCEIENPKFQIHCLKPE